MKKRRAAAVAAMVSFSYGAGCSLFVDTSDLAGDLAADASSDVQGERASGEGGDSSARVDADGGKACDATFCDDFDDGALGATWTSTTLTKSGVLELGATAHSAPNALRARFETSTPQGDRDAFLEKDLGRGTRLRCDFFVFVEVPPESDFVDIVRVRTTAAGVADYNLLFGVSPVGGATFREDLFLTDGGCGCPRKEASPPAVPLSRWVAVTLETDFATASLSYDGRVVAAGPFAGFTPSSNVFVAIGTRAYKQQPSVVLFDDVSCSLAP